jgi:hypothetical protein
VVKKFNHKPKKPFIMKPTEILAFVAGAAAATGITLLFTTDKGRDLRNNVSEKLSKEELDKLIAKLKCRRDEVAAEEAIENAMDEELND